MPYKKIPFERFEEGDEFSYRDIEDRFEAAEDALGTGFGDGLAAGMVADGAINWQHLSSPGHATSRGYGSTVISTHVARGIPPKGARKFIRYIPTDSVHGGNLLLRGVGGVGWSANKGIVPGGGSIASVGGNPSNEGDAVIPHAMYVTGLDAHLGSNFRTSKPEYFSAGLLIMFNLACYTSANHGLGFEVNFTDQNGNEHPIIGSDRYVYDPHSHLQGFSYSGMSVASPSMGRPMDIRIWLSRSRARFAMENGPHTVTAADKNDLVVNQVSIKMAAIDAHPALNPVIDIGTGYLTVMNFRAYQ
jgi:hypothetical protein